MLCLHEKNLNWNFLDTKIVHLHFKDLKKIVRFRSEIREGVFVSFRYATETENSTPKFYRQRI